ncbi:MAG TPA: RICIN domain-containing protein [Desulfuromonadaceae bacterium]|nr:RICIN domain-containing protein [Desulfuromonadaceae bacterium]
MRLAPVSAIALLSLTFALTASAQIGSGWSVATFSQRFEYESNDILKSISPPPSSFNNGVCAFTRNGNVDHFQLLTHRSNRAEIRPNDDYSTGSRQFQAYVLIKSPTTGESIHQIFNGPNGPWLLLKETSVDNGSIHMGAATTSLATNVYGRWFRLNSINDMNSGKTDFYINGSHVWGGSNPGGTFYTKYGAYGTHDDAHPADITFSNIVLYSGGSASGGGSIDTSAIYQIQNEASGLVLNQQGSLTNGSKITQWSSSSTSDNLRWTFIPTSNGYYQINSVKSGKDAVVQSASTAAGAGIIQWDFGTSGDDQWKPVQNSDGSFTFYNLKSGLVLDDPGSSTSTSTQIIQYTANGGANQSWKLIKQ